MDLEELDFITQFCKQDSETLLLWYSQASTEEIEKITELLAEMDDMLTKQLKELDPSNELVLQHKRNLH